MTRPDTPSDFSRAVLDSLSFQIAVVDSSGTICQTNRAWETFGRENGREGDADSVGENYLTVCTASLDDSAAQAAAGIEAVIDGDRESFEFEYPCHSPDEERWFRMVVTAFESDGARYGVVVHHDITDRKRAEMAVEDAMADLAAEREQLALLNQLVRHDIRNDMNVVVGWAGLLEDHVSEEGRDYLGRITQTSRHVIELTETVGDLAEVLTGEGQPPLEPVDLVAVVRNEVEKVQTAYDTREQTVDVRGLDTLPERVDVLANEMLSSVFGNLLTNAVVHNDGSRARIDVDCTVGAETVTVCLADDGPGVPDDVEEALFERGRHSVESGGQGLGLYLVRNLVDHYGGDVWVDDDDTAGATFCVELQRV